MFTVTNTIFFILLDIIVSAVLIGATMMILGIIALVVSGFFISIFSYKKSQENDDTKGEKL